MKGFEQILDFLYYALVLGLVVFCLYFFTIPGNIERFREILLWLAPLIFLIAAMMFKLKRTYKASNEDQNMDFGIRLTYIDRMKLELALYALPIVLLILNVILGNMDVYLMLEIIVIYVINSYVLRSIFNRPV